MNERAYITPKVLKWARESARISRESIASKISVKEEKIKEWEEGKSFPTMNQAKNLAKKYRRPFAILFLPDIPKDFYPLQDFRKKGSTPLSTSSLFIIREIQQKQSWVRDLYVESDESKLPFVGKFSIKDKPENVARDILETLNIQPGKYITRNPLKEWIEAAETQGIFVSRTSFIHSRLKIDPNELQGFAIADEYAPFVFINSKDWNSSQLFTLVHELAHIWIVESGISNQIEQVAQNRSKYHPVELFCNEVAANVLMPASEMRNFNNKILENPSKVFNSYKRLGVSTLALLFRLKKLNLISSKKYFSLKKTATYEFETFLKKQVEASEKKKEDKGGPNYFLLQMNRNGRLFTQTVLDTFKNGIVEPALASSLLNVKINKFQKLEAQMYK